MGMAWKMRVISGTLRFLVSGTKQRVKKKKVDVVAMKRRNAHSRATWSSTGNENATAQFAT
jgi:hypothetical protein